MANPWRRSARSGADRPIASGFAPFGRTDESRAAGATVSVSALTESGEELMMRPFLVSLRDTFLGTLAAL